MNRAAYLVEIIAGLLSRSVVEGDWTQWTVWTRTILTERRWNGDRTETWHIAWIGPYHVEPQATDFKCQKYIMVGVFFVTWTFKFKKCSYSEKQLHKIYLMKLRAPNRIEIFKNCSLFVEDGAITWSISLFIRLHLLAFTSSLPCFNHL